MAMSLGGGDVAPGQNYAEVAPAAEPFATDGFFDLPEDMDDIGEIQQNPFHNPPPTNQVVQFARIPDDEARALISRAFKRAV